jgi:hypothetical protein
MIKRNSRIFFWLVILAGLLFVNGPNFSVFTEQQTGDLVINEFMASNGTGLTDEDGDYSDWIELYNRGSQPVNLAGWALTDDPTRPDKWTFPDMSLKGGEYLVVFASGKNRRGAGPALRTNFRLRQSGDFLGLYRILDQQFVDVHTPQFPDQKRDISYGRYGGESAYGYLNKPTPGLPNDGSELWAGAISPVAFSVKRGFYDSPFTVRLSTTIPEATIRYTTDGSEPTEMRGEIYTGPIKIETTTLVRAAAFKPNYLPSPVTTQSYLFLEDVLTQPAQPPDFPDTWGIHPIDFKDYRQGAPVIADYEMDPEIANNPRYREALKEGLTSIPTLSLGMDVQDFTDLYSHPRDRGITWERPVSVELIYGDNLREGFQINAGVRIHGGVGRSEFIPKHSFRLLFKGQYGPTKLRYPLFPASPVEEFNTLVLRAEADRSFAGTGPIRERATYTRDEWLRASQIAMSGFGVHGIFVHLYINGLYWGLYNLVERPDAAFVSSYLGGQEEDWIVANQEGPLERDLSEEAKKVINLFLTIGFAGRTVEGSEQRGAELLEKYARVISYIDPIAFSDYMILNWYAGTQDWPENNWYAAIPIQGGEVGQGRYFVWDGQETFLDDGAAIRFGKVDSSRLNIIKPLFDILIQNPDFKIQLADRMYRHLFNDGVLSDAEAQARWLRLNQVINQAIIGESARWGDTRHEAPITREDWLKAGDDVLAQMDGNAERLIALAREAAYYPAIDPPLFNQNSGLVPAGFKLELDMPPSAAGAGYTIYYTTDGADPRLPGTGAVAPGALPYQEPIILTTTVHLKARLLKTTGPDEQIWSALNEASFNITEQVSQLQITELMYNPVDGNSYEFIELKNGGNAPLDLASLSFEGVRFTFPANMPPLEPGQFIVLAANPESFARRYPEVDIGGVYEGQLSNSGETLALKDGQGQTVVSVAYDDENGWPISPDGRGDSLTLIKFEEDPNDPKSWQASANLNGSPGADDPVLDLAEIKP